MAAGPQLPERAESSFDYRLRRCEGFRVDSPQGRVGFVEEVRYASRLDRPALIAVRAGLLGRLLLIVPAGEIAEILPSEERVVLRRSPRVSATERPQELREPAHGGRRRAASSAVEGVGAGAEHVEAQREVEAMIERLTRRIRLRFGRGGERGMTPDIEASAEQSAEEPPAEEQAGEEPAAEQAPAAGTAEAVPAEEPAPEEPAAEEPPAEEQPTA